MVYTEKMRKAHREYYKKNRKRILIQTEKWRKKNRYKVNNLQRERYRKNSKKMLKYYKKWRQNREKNGKCVICGRKKKSKLFCEKCLKRERSKMKDKITRFMALQKICGHRIPRCIICKEMNFDFLEIHHKDGISNEKRENRIDIDREIMNGSRKINDLEVRCLFCHKKIHKKTKNKRQFEKILKEKKIIRKSDFLK